MNLQRILSILVAILMLSESVLGSDPEKALQVRESDQGNLIRDRRVSLDLDGGARIDGRVREVTDTSLVFKVKKSSDLAAYPKGKIQVPREAVSGIEVRGLEHDNTQRNSATPATFLGALLGSFYVVSLLQKSSGRGIFGL